MLDQALGHLQTRTLLQIAAHVEGLMPGLFASDRRTPRRYMYISICSCEATFKWQKSHCQEVPKAMLRPEQVSR